VGDDGSEELDETRSLIRQVRQRLESLRRAGVDRIPRSPSRAKPGDNRAFRAAPAEGVREPPRDESAAGALAAGGADERSEPAATPVPVPVAEGPTRAEPRPARAHRPRAAVPEPLAVVGSLFDNPGFDTPPIQASERPRVLAEAAAEVAVCMRCPHLAATRTQTVFGTGSPVARLMFIGEAPGVDEDRLGEPFVGRAGQLLTDMITKGMGLAREDVYIANILKCRPPDNRQPTGEEATNCSPYLERQIEIIRPEYLCLLGKTAASALLELNPSASMGQLRGKWHRYRGIPTLVSYHPAYLLRTPAAKKDSWEDLQILMRAMGLKIPRRSS
jgi:DNA polymerase